MNLDRISFRTNEKERQLLTRLNQQYKCKTATQLMHMLFNEIENKTFLNTNPPHDANIFGDLNDQPKKPGAEGTMTPEQELDRLFPEMMIPNNPMFSNESKVEEEKDRRNDQLDMLIEHCRKLESLKNAMNRTLPYGCRHF